MGLQVSLFGDPPLRPELSQWHTPAWLARKGARWIPRGSRILEPACGGGALLDGLLRSGHSPACLTGVEIDGAWHAHASAILPGLRIDCGDFLAMSFGPDDFDAVYMNPPYECDLHARFVARALEIAPTVVAIVPASVEFGVSRDRDLWSSRGVVTRRARMPARPDFGGDSSGKFDVVCLLIERRRGPRFDGEIMPVHEEVWTP